MSHHVHQEQSPPKTWEQFEELCADLFAEELHVDLVRVTYHDNGSPSPLDSP